MRQKIKCNTKRLAAFCLAVAMVITMLPATVAEAATNSMTMYVGEALSFTTYSKVSKVTSSKSKIVKAAKNKENDIYADLTAKKVGKSTVTVKAKNGTSKLNITVKKLDMPVGIVSIAGGYVTFAIRNKTAQTFDKIQFKYTLKNAAGEIIKQDTELVHDVIAKKTAYESVYIGKEQAELLDLASCAAKVTGIAHDPRYIYKNVSSKVTATVKDEKEEANSIEFSVTVKNTTNQTVNGYYYVMIYDAADKLIGVDKRSIYLSKKATNTSTTNYISKYSYPTYDHYKIDVQAFYSVRDKNW